MRIPIRVMERDFTLVTEVDEYSSLQIERSWHDIKPLVMVVNRHNEQANELQIGRIIFPGAQTHKAYVIKDREIELTEDGKASEDWTVTAVPLKHWLTQRATIPLSGSAYDRVNGDAETAMRQFVQNNVITPENLDRVMDDIVLDTNLNRGEVSTYQTRFKMLSEELRDISLFSGLGWTIDIDLSLQKFVFKVLEGRDLTATQTVLPPAIFAPDRDSIGRLRYTETTLNYKNVAIVAGQGEGVDRRVIETGVGTGYDRYELFVDARDVPEETEDETPVPRPVEDIEADLIARGQQNLADYRQEQFMDAQALTNESLKYERDYDLGDMVTLRNRDWGITLDARITEVKEIYEPTGFKLELVFDNDRPTFVDKLNRKFTNINVETTR